MSPFRVDRNRREEDRFLGQKMLFFVLGAIAGLAGMATNTDWLIYLAVLLLVVGLVLRTLDSRHRQARRAMEAADDEYVNDGDVDDGNMDDGDVDDGDVDDTRSGDTHDEHARGHDLERDRQGPPGGSAD